MRNSWKLSTFVLAAVLVAMVGREVIIGDAAADSDPYQVDARTRLQSALSDLKSAAASLTAVDVGKKAPEKTPSGGKQAGGSSYRAKAVALTNAAIIQVESALKTEK